MNIGIVGSGYVGLVTAACLAEVGNRVTCQDVDADKVARLQQGQVPIFEPGLGRMLRRNAEAGRIAFTTDLGALVNHVDVLFIAVGTPPDEDGSADLSHVLAVADNIGQRLERYTLVVNKSTVPVGTGLRVREYIQRGLDARNLECEFDVASNPEFLKEGAAIQDFMYPDRVVIGTESERATRLLKEIYTPFNRTRDKVHVMDIASSELTKYASNAILATKISLINEIANIADRVGANIEQVRQAMGADPRIGYHFIYPGVGYGGSCFPKDVKALAQMADALAYDAQLLKAVESVNNRQKQVLYEKMRAHLGDLRGLRIAVWGLTFKPNTDDIREAPALAMIERLLADGAVVQAYDPKGIEHTRAQLGERPNLHFATSAEDAAQDADALALLTEWKEFWSIDFAQLKARMRGAALFDGRNIWNPERVRQAGFHYSGIGLR